MLELIKQMKLRHEYADVVYILPYGIISGNSERDRDVSSSSRGRTERARSIKTFCEVRRQKMLIRKEPGYKRDCFMIHFMMANLSVL